MRPASHGTTLEFTCGGLDFKPKVSLVHVYRLYAPEPTIFRATEQWFASVEGFRDEVGRIGAAGRLPTVCP